MQCNIDKFASFKTYHDAQRSNLHPRDIRELCSQLQWPGARSPRFQAVCVFTWSNVDFTEIQLSYRRGRWRTAIYKISANGAPELLCKDYSVACQ